MTSAQLDQFQKKLSSIQKAELVSSDDEKCQYIFVWWCNQTNGKYRLDYIFVIYENLLLKRIEIDGYLRSYVLQALEQVLKK